MNSKLKFFQNHPSLTIKYISKYYPFTFSELNKYKNLLNWQAVSSNEQINFTENIIRKFQRKWWVYELIQNPKVIWNSRLIITFEKQIFKKSKDILFENHDFYPSDYDDGSIPLLERDIRYRLALNESFPWNLVLLLKQKKRIDWFQLSANSNIKWSKEILEKFKSEFDWDILSVSWKYWSYLTLKYFNDNYPNLINWSSLSKNESMKWTNKIIDVFSHFLDFDSLSSNKKLPWNEVLIDKFKDLWNWTKLTNNESIQWNKEMLSKYVNYIKGNIIEVYLESQLNVKSINNEKELSIIYTQLKSRYLKFNKQLSNGKSGSYQKEDFISDYWFYLCRSSNPILTISFIKKFRDKVDWMAMSDNFNIKWSLKLINSFKENWDWGSLSQNKSIFWTEEMLLLFKDKVNWFSILLNCNFNLSLGGIKKLKDYLFSSYDFINDFIVNRKALPWSIDLIELVEQHLILNHPWFNSTLEDFGNKLGFHNRVIISKINIIKELLAPHKSYNPLIKSLEVIYDYILCGNYYLARQRTKKMIANIEDIDKKDRSAEITKTLGNLRSLEFCIYDLQEYYSRWKDLDIPWEYNIFNEKERSSYCKTKSLNENDIKLTLINKNEELFEDLRNDIALILITDYVESLKEEYVLNFWQWQNKFQRFISKNDLHTLLKNIKPECERLGLLKSEKEYEKDEIAAYYNYGKYGHESDYQYVDREKYELAEILGYDEPDIDDISIDDIKERTGH